MAKTCSLFTYLCFILLTGELNICGLERDGKLTGLCRLMDVLPSRSLSSESYELMYCEEKSSTRVTNKSIKTSFNLKRPLLDTILNESSSSEKVHPMF